MPKMKKGAMKKHMASKEEKAEFAKPKGKGKSPMGKATKVAYGKK